MEEGTKLHSFASGFKDVFKREREKAGYTQKSFAEYFDISLDTVRNWEQGRKVPEIKTVERLCAEFACEPDYLLGRMEHSTHDMQFICSQTGLSEDAVLALSRLREDCAAIQVLDFLLINKAVLEKIALYFASAFWDIDRRIEFRTFNQLGQELGLSFNLNGVDSRLFTADAHESIALGKKSFQELNDKEGNDIGRQMTFKLFRACMSKSDIEKMQKHMYDHRDDPQTTPQLSLIAEFLIRTGDGDYMQRAGCNLGRFFQLSSNAEEGTQDGTD